jgi:hypothetical protein
MSESFLTDFQRRMTMEENETNLNGLGYESDSSSEDLRIMEREESRSLNYLDLVTLHDPSYNSHDLDEPTITTETLESIESDTEGLLSERMVARAAHLEKVSRSNILPLLSIVFVLVWDRRMSLIGAKWSDQDFIIRTRL